jgi:iron complex transport system ATP-binding protein
VAQRQPETAALSARDIVYEVDGARLLDCVSLQARRGELLGLIGPNGAGKTTLLRTVSGLLRRTEGSVTLTGRDLDDMRPAEVARVIAHVAQVHGSTLGFTGMDVVLMGRYPHMGRFQVEGPEDRRIATEAMRRTGTEGFASRRTATLSGGERQRLFIARALAQEPSILLLDEPTANLDIQHQLAILELVRSLARQGMTAIAAMHDLSLAARFCDRLLLLHRGRVVAEGPAESVLTPGNIRDTFGVEAQVYRDPLNGALALSLLGPVGPDVTSRDGTGAGPE